MYVWKILTEVVQITNLNVLHHNAMRFLNFISCLILYCSYLKLRFSTACKKNSIKSFNWHNLCHIGCRIKFIYNEWFETITDGLDWWLIPDPDVELVSEIVDILLLYSSVACCWCCNSCNCWCCWCCAICAAACCIWRFWRM